MEEIRKKIIIVDDDRTYLTVARIALIDKYDVFTLPSGEKLFRLLKKITPDLILLDVDMPEMNGYEVIKLLKESEDTADIPVIFLSVLINPESEIVGLDLGAVDFILKPFSRELLLKRIATHLLLAGQQQELKRKKTSLEGIVVEKTQAVFELQYAILNTLVEFVECRDDMTGRHIERTQNYLRLLINLLLQNDIYTEEISSWDINLVVMSSQLHDVGKIAIKDYILLKPGKLLEMEFEEMKKHVMFGLKIVERIKENTRENAFLQYAKTLVGHHHERWDGTGYPCGIKNEDIPLLGRLMAIVDVYDALISERPYKEKFPHAEAVEIIKNKLGTHFDPLAGAIFVKYEQEFANASLQNEERKYV